MFNTNELDKELVIIIATGLLGYARLLCLKPNTTYVPPTKEEVVREYQNVQMFNRTVDMIVSRLRHIEQTNKIAVHNCNDNIIGESPNYYCGICGQCIR